MVNTRKFYTYIPIVLFSIASISVAAQDLKGSYQIGIGAQVLNMNKSNYPKSPSFIPYVPFRVHGGYYLTNRLMLGVETGFYTSTFRFETSDFRTYNFLIGPFAQYMLTKEDKNLKFYLLSGIQYSQRQIDGKDMDSGETGQTNSRTLLFRFGGGLMYRISPSFSLDANLSMGFGSLYFNTSMNSFSNADLNYELQLRLIYHFGNRRKK